MLKAAVNLQVWDFTSLAIDYLKKFGNKERVENTLRFYNTVLVHKTNEGDIELDKSETLKEAGLTNGSRIYIKGVQKEPETRFRLG